MRRIIFIILFLLFADINISAQNIDSVDRKTYSLFINGKWNELINETEKAIDGGTDFYYLRMRAGIALLSQEKYFSAVEHFERALEFLPADSIAVEYLFYSYSGCGRYDDARNLVPKMTSFLKRKLIINENDYFKGMAFETGYSYNSDYNRRKKEPLNVSAPGTGLIFSEKDITNNTKYFSVGLIHQLSDFVSVFHCLNYTGVSGILRTNEFINGTKDFDLSIKQVEYYLSVRTPLGNGFDGTFALHYLSASTQNMYFWYDTRYNPPPAVYYKTDIPLSDFLLLASFGKYYKNFRFEFTNSYSGFNNSKQFQNSFSFIFYPFSNLNLYTVSDLIIHTQKDTASSMTNALFNQKIGFKLFRNLWAEVFYYYGDVYNYNENNGYVIYNNIYKIKDRAGINFIFPVNRFQFYLQYMYYSGEQPDVTYTSPFNFKSTNIINKTHKIIGGFKWLF